MSEIKPRSMWVHRTGSAQYPRDAYAVHEVKDDTVSFCRQGGGFMSSLPTQKFLYQFRLPTAAEIEAAKSPDLAYYDLDDCPGFLGFTYGTRWNGWGKPDCEAGALKIWLKKMWDEGLFTDDCGTQLYFNDEGQLIERFENPEVGGDEPEYVEEVIEPREIEFRGMSFTVYDISIGWCWNQYDLDELKEPERHFSAELLDDIRKMIIPEGLEPYTRMKNKYMVTIDVRHGDHTTKRKVLAEADGEKQAEEIAIASEAGRAGDDPDDLSEGDGGFYSKFGEFHYSIHSVIKINQEEARVLAEFLPLERGFGCLSH